MYLCLPAADFARARPPADQPEDDPVWARKLLRYTLSLGVTTAISPGHLDLFTMLASFAIGKTEEDLPPLTEEEEAEMLERYCDKTGRDGIPNWPLFVAFACFRSAAIIQGVAARAARGNASSASADPVRDGNRARRVAETGAAVARG